MKASERCAWCTSHPLYIEYHDNEWGVPEAGAQALFERLILEGMQAGLSWWTVLQKRAHMREMFFHFDPDRLANASEADVQRWLGDAGLIRHRGKLQAMVGNARAFLDLQSFPEFVWSSVDGVPRINQHSQLAQVPAYTEEASMLARRLKKAGFRFVGATTVYAFMQSAGLVNDHLISCPSHGVCEESARGFSL